MAGRRDNTAAVVERIQYSFVPNHRDTMEALAHSRFSNQEFRVVISLLNQTNGYLRDEDRLSLGFWSRLTGMSRQHLCHTIRRLLDKNVISRNGDSYRVNRPAQWLPASLKLLPKQATKPKARIRHTKEKALPLQATAAVKERQPPPQATLPKQAILFAQTGNISLPERATPPDTNQLCPKENYKENVIKKREIPTVSPAAQDAVPKTYTEESSPKPSPRIKPKQAEAGIFLDMVEQQIDTKLVNRAKLQGLIRPLLVKFPDATPERLMECFRWLKENDPYCRTRDSPMVVSLLPSKYPEWAAGKLPTPGGREERYGKHGEHEPGIRGDTRQDRLRPITRISGFQED